MAREELHHCTTKHADRGTGRLHMPQTTNIQKRVPHDGVARNMQMLFHCSDGNRQLVFVLIWWLPRYRSLHFTTPQPIQQPQIQTIAEVVVAEMESFFKVALQM